MTDDHRRSTRYEDFLSSIITVGNEKVASQVAGPFSARIVDISNHGACLLLTEVQQNSFHIFHSAREQTDSALRLEIKLPPSQDSVLILARPVWLHTETAGGVKIFRLGIDFLSPIDNNLLFQINKMINKA